MGVKQKVCSLCGRVAFIGRTKSRCWTCRGGADATTEQFVAYRITSYSERNAILRKMGFATYKDYLKSDMWLSIRARVLTANPLCPCGKAATQVHHRKYRKKDLEGRSLAFLQSVCHSCHEVAEFDEFGVKQHVKASNRRLDQRS